MKTLNQLMQEALQVQDACNLSGVVNSFSRAIASLRENGITDTDSINSHPVSVLYSSKIASLTGSDDASTFSRAFSACAEA